ncbi:unnamed protein product [Mytilus edulis]|uniref:Uncharacterized protein n=1 Tax=Mytilus edulis TaxID=6550 RepID=A0A8S3TH80_MYTED|nr:unnamed protein product [Mytilus edulis]
MEEIHSDSLYELPKYPHCAIICGQTGCGKTEFVLDLLEKEYSEVFKYIVILCPTIQWNKAYKNREWIGDVRKPKTKNLIIVNPIVEVREANGSLYEEEKLQELLRMFFKKYAGHSTLYIIDDCSATKELTKKKRYAVRACIFRKTCGTISVGHFTEIQLCFKRFKRTNKMVMHVLHKR